MKGDSRTSPMYYSRAKKEKKSNKKRVSFHHTAFVVLIPTVHEYHKAGLGDKLWWNDLDFHSFKQEASQEIREFLKSSSLAIDAKRAMKLYFQQFFDPVDVSNTHQNLSITQNHQLNEVRPVLPVNDSLTSSKFSLQSRPSFDDETVQISTPTPSEIEAAGMDFSVIARMMAVGLLVLINRN